MALEVPSHIAFGDPRLPLFCLRGDDRAKEVVVVVVERVQLPVAPVVRPVLVVSSPQYYSESWEYSSSRASSSYWRARVGICKLQDPPHLQTPDFVIPKPKSTGPKVLSKRILSFRVRAVCLLVLSASLLTRWIKPTVVICPISCCVLPVPFLLHRLHRFMFAQVCSVEKWQLVVDGIPDSVSEGLLACFVAETQDSQPSQLSESFNHSTKAVWCGNSAVLLGELPPGVPPSRHRATGHL